MSNNTRWCPVCGSELWALTPCPVCAQRQREAEQQNANRRKLDKWEADHPVSLPLDTILPNRWDNGRPDYDKDRFNGPLRWNAAARCINELYNMIEDLKFELAEKEEAENDHRCSQCGSPEGRQVT